jgi:hypothetical protein
LSGAGEAVERVLLRAGVAVSSSPTALPFTAPDAVPLRGPAVAIYDGQLGAEHARLFERSPPAYLLALRDGDRPSEWEARLLASVLRDEPWRVGERLKVCSLEGINDACALAAEVATAAKGKASAVGVASDVMHELCANALLDAPAGTDGRPRYAHRRAESGLSIDPADACEAAVGVDPKNHRMLLWAGDRFGRMTQAALARAISSLGAPAAVDRSGGGAGLGLRRLLEASDAVAFRVRPGEWCEALAVVDLSGQRRRSSSAKTILFHLS